MDGSSPTPLAAPRWERGPAIVQLYGRQLTAGLVEEFEAYGARMLRLLIPRGGDFANGFTEVHYTAAAIFGVTPCSDDAVALFFLTLRRERQALLAALQDGRLDAETTAVVLDRMRQERQRASPLMAAIGGVGERVPRAAEEPPTFDPEEVGL